MLYKRFVALVFVIFCLSGCRTGYDPVDSGTSYAATALKPYVESGELPGAISVFYWDGVQETCCIGWADVAAERPITLDSPFMQCSQTKGFCGVTIAKLVEEGRLNLDDPVSKYLPEFKTLWVEAPGTNDVQAQFKVLWGDAIDRREVRTLAKAKNVLTVRMCLNHTGGFPFETSVKRNDVRGGGWSGGARVRQTAAVAAASPLLFEPGTGVQYSNTGIDVAAAIVEVITGLKWEDYLQMTVLDPLEMKTTTFWPTDAQLAEKIEMYECVSNSPAVWRAENSWEQRPYNDDHVFASAGAGLWTTVRDQLKFYKMLMNLGVGDNGVRILKEETVRNLLAVSTRGDNPDGYSLGLHAPAVDNEDAWFGHGGAWGSSCEVNWHRRLLRLWVVQLVGGPHPWTKDFYRAVDTFFSKKVDKSGAEAYTGRTK